MKKLFLVAVFICFFLSGCCFNSDKREVIRFSTWGSASEMSILRPIISDFEKKNPDIKVEVLHIPQDYFQKLHLLFASKTEPDVMLINNQNIPVYAKFLTDMSDSFDKNFYFEKSISAVSFQDRVYAIPRDCSGLVVYYNIDKFRQKRLPLPTSKWTVEDMIAIAQKLTDKDCFGISYEPSIYYAHPFINYYGGGLFLLKDGETRFVGNTYQSRVGIFVYKELAYLHKCAPTPSKVGSKTLAQMFIEGKIAMHISGRWLVPKYRDAIKFNWDVVNFPEYSAPSDASGWAISARSKHKESALRFVEFLSNKANIEKITQSGLIVPARKDVAYSDSFLKGKPNPKVFIQSVEKSPVTVVCPEYNKKVEYMNEVYFNE